MLIPVVIKLSQNINLNYANSSDLMSSNRNGVKKMKVIVTVAFSVLISMFQIAAFADPVNFTCQVNVNRVLVYGDGSVNVLTSGRNDYTYICSLKNERQGVNVATCAMWVSILQNVQNQNAQAFFYYSTDKATSCQNLPTYGNSPAPVYITMVKQ